MADYGYGGGAPSMPGPYGRMRSPRYRRSGAQSYADSGMDYSSGAPDLSGYGGYSALAPQSGNVPGPYGKMAPAPSSPAGPYSGYGTSNAFVGPGGQFSGNQGVGATIADFYRQGAFDPSGGGAYWEAIKGDLAAREQSDVAQAGLTSDLYGGDDPLARQYGRLNAEQGARNRYALLGPQLRAQIAQQRQQEIYNLLNQRLGSVDYYREPKTDYGAIAGDVLGAATGGIVGNLTGGGKKKKGSG
jgi:hypothetical protein